jgi:meiosis-specific APC/C activator protein AMA1
VKALSYCPWAKSLLATGGGSKDRCIRFWHTNSGTLLREHKTTAQITSLVWSVYSKQIAATFGFGTGGKSVMIYVYEYPKMTRLLEVPATSSDLRILSSTISPDNCSLCVATNDSTIRIYRLWNVSHRLIEADSNGEGDYGSQLIQLNEGISERLDGIR